MAGESRRLPICALHPARAAASPTAATPSAAACARTTPAVTNLHFGSGFETELPFGDDRLSDLQPFFHDDVIADALAA